MQKYLLIAIGGALGSVTRYLVGSTVVNRMGTRFPYGTFVINLTACLIIGIKPDKISAYEALHAASNQGVRDLLDKYHMNNFSIYIQKMDESHYYLFAYYEYTGNNYKQDMDTLAREPRNIAWLSKTDAMQIPFAGEKSWTKMQEVFHNP